MVLRKMIGDGWKYLTSEIDDSIQLVGDDLFVTQEKILQKGIDEKCGNAILIKVNQVELLQNPRHYEFG